MKGFCTSAGLPAGSRTSAGTHDPRSPRLDPREGTPRPPSSPFPGPSSLLAFRRRSAFGRVISGIRSSRMPISSGMTGGCSRSGVVAVASAHRRTVLPRLRLPPGDGQASARSRGGVVAASADLETIRHDGVMFWPRTRLTSEGRQSRLRFPNRRPSDPNPDGCHTLRRGGCTISSPPESRGWGTAGRTSSGQRPLRIGLYRRWLAVTSWGGSTDER